MKLLGIVLLFSGGLLFQNGFSQTQSGDFFLGGSFYAQRARVYRADTTTYSTIKSESASFSPSLKVFITPHITVGGYASLLYSNFINTEIIDDTLNTNETQILQKLRRIRVAMGASLSYYYPIYKEKLVWGNTFAYERGYDADGISFASFISEEAQTFTRQYFSQYFLISELHYFFKPYLSLSTGVQMFSLYCHNKNINFSVFKANYPLTFSLNYLIQNNDK